MQYVFGPYVLDTSTKVLMFSNVRVEMQPKTVEILGLLLDRANSIVTRQEIFDLAWGDADLDENNLTQQVFAARKILEQHTPDAVFIVTHAGRGYSFVGEVRQYVETPDISTEEPWQQLLRGCYKSDKRTRLSAYQAIQHFEAALAIDHQFDLALIGKAEAHLFIAEHLLGEPSVHFAAAELCARAVLVNNPHSGEALAVLGDVELFRNWDRCTAWQLYERAVHLAPSSAQVRINRAWFLVLEGRHDLARNELEFALKQDPVSLKLLTMLGAISMYGDRLDEAIVHLNNVLSMERNYELAARYFAESLAIAGEFERAIDVAASLTGGSYAQRSIAIIGFCKGRLGDLSGAQSAVDSLCKMAETSFVSSFSVAQIFVAIGKAALAIDIVRQGIGRRDPWLALLRAHPVFESLRGIEGFQQVVKTVSNGGRPNEDGATCSEGRRNTA